ncbi:MAG: alpha/beta hydrolase [Nocardioides sp.]|nr:alpha/beta hydrolase [Nocardioides sp.]
MADLDPDRTTPDAVLRYAAHDEGILDVHLPPSYDAGDGGTDAAAVLFLVHGGFWRVEHDRTHTRPMARALADAGLVVVTPEYRRVGGRGDLAGGWPTTAEDVATAYDALPGLLSELGVRIGRLTALGHSAGGHLVLWLATRADEGDGPRLDRVVGLAPVGDLCAAAAERMGNGAVQGFLGGEPADVPSHYAAADPALRLDSRPRAEVVVVHGEADEHVGLANTLGLEARHPWILLTRIEGADHFDVIDPGSEAWPVVLAAARADAVV